MLVLRALLFNLLFYGLTAALCVLALPALLLPRGVLVALGRVWARLLVACLAVCVGIRHDTSCAASSTAMAAPSTPSSTSRPGTPSCCRSWCAIRRS
jgi:hypothetical protein